VWGLHIRLLQKDVREHNFVHTVTQPSFCTFHYIFDNWIQLDHKINMFNGLYGQVAGSWVRDEEIRVPSNAGNFLADTEYISRF